MATNRDNYKPPLFERFFDERWDQGKKSVANPIVTLKDISRGIGRFNEGKPEGLHVSNKNPANFFKDFVRKLNRANEIWPTDILQKGWTATQSTGKGNSFEFIPLPVGQTKPFVLIEPDADAEELKLQTLSLPFMSRLLGKKHETWLMQVAVRLFIIESHLAIHSSNNLIYVDHLQMGIKQPLAEIDALYLGRRQGKNNEGDELLITVEAKVKDDIYDGQIRAQVEAARQMKGLNKKARDILPMALKALGNNKLFVVEFETVKVGDEIPKVLQVNNKHVYSLHPEVKGIS